MSSATVLDKPLMCFAVIWKLNFADNQNRVLRHDMMNGLADMHRLMVDTDVTLSDWMYMRLLAQTGAHLHTARNIANISLQFM